jgi:3-phenylpropionate/trans-cinnamate dioxygenase ferredoxin component
MALLRVCNKSELSNGSAIRIDDPEIAVFNVDGELFAIKDVCTHDEARLSEGELTGDTVVCPLHGACFSVKSGEALSLPATEPVEIFPVIIKGDEVYVEI